MKKIIISIFVFCVFLFSGCKKESDTQIDPLGKIPENFVQRVLIWNNFIPARLAENNKVGIAMLTSLQQDSALIKVHVCFKETLAGDIRLNVFITEDNIPARSQKGADSGYIHQQVLRDIVSKSKGDAIVVSSEKEIVMNYTAPVNNFNVANLHVVAFVSRWDSSLQKYEVYNSREVKLGETAKWE